MRLKIPHFSIYKKGILPEFFCFIAILIALGIVNIFPFAQHLAHTFNIYKYVDYIIMLIVIVILILMTWPFNYWLNKFGGNVVSKTGRRINGLVASTALDTFLISCLFFVSIELAPQSIKSFLQTMVTEGLWPWDENKIRAGNLSRSEEGIQVLIILSGLFCLRGLAREFISKLIQPFHDFLTERKMGIGGSSKFAGLIEEWGKRYKPNSILLGTSLYEPAWRIGHKDDRHILTIGSPRSGKGRSAIIPNLLTWPYSAIVIDPKGGNAAVTAARRGHGGGRVKHYMGQDVYVIDPFNVTGKTAHFNPLSVLDPQSFTIVEDIKIISEALVPWTSDSDQHWTNGAREMVNMIIGHELTKSDRKDDPTLLDVRKGITGLNKHTLAEMLNNTDCGGSIQRSAQRFSSGWETNEIRNIMSGAASNTDWLDSKPMQQTLSQTDFDISDLKKKHKTLYLVLPTHYLDAHKRFLRLFINITMDAVSKSGMGGDPVLFILDEFYALGRIDGIVTKAATLPEAGVKLWPIVQNIGQIAELYGKNMEGLLSGVGILQVIGTNDQETEQWISNQFGNSAFERNVDGNTNVAVAKLREPSEIGKDLSRRKGKQFVKIAGENPMMLGRIFYDKDFHKSWWNNPPGREGIFEPIMMEIEHLADTIINPKPKPPQVAIDTKDTGDTDTSRIIPAYISKDKKPQPVQNIWKSPVKTDPDEIIIESSKDEVVEEISNKDIEAVDNEQNLTALEELDLLVGLDDVKFQAKKVLANIINARRRREQGMTVAPISYHLVFTGNPGTGKTTVAKIIGKIYKESGLLKKGHLVQANREKLVASYLGQSATKTQEIIDSALDGILFIDEAYSLTPPDKKDNFGSEVVSTLLEAMENQRDKLIVIVAGYSNEMQQFINSNPGLKSRFKTTIDFPDYNGAELFKIFQLLCSENDYALSKPATTKVKDWLNDAYENRTENFGNGRTVRNFFEECIENQALRLMNIKSNDLNEGDYSRLEPSDISGVSE